MSGKYATATSTTNTNKTVHTFTEMATINLEVLNRDAVAGQIKIWISESDPLSDADIIEDGMDLVPAHGLLIRTAIAVSAGERIIINASTDLFSVRVHGISGAA